MRLVITAWSISAFSTVRWIVCNSPTPPKNNCVRDDFKCPFDSNQLCTITTDDKSSIDNIINGYVYEAGNAQTFKNTVEKDKSCPNGLTWNKALETGGVAVSDEVKLAIDIEGVLAQ